MVQRCVVQLLEQVAQSFCDVTMDPTTREAVNEAWQLALWMLQELLGSVSANFIFFFLHFKGPSASPSRYRGLMTVVKSCRVLSEKLVELFLSLHLSRLTISSPCLKLDFFP